MHVAYVRVCVCVWQGTLSCIINKYAATRFERRAVGPHAVSVNRNSGEFGSVVAVASKLWDHCRVRFPISHVMHAHTHTHKHV